VVALVVVFIRSLRPPQSHAQPKPATVVLRYPESPPAVDTQIAQGEPSTSAPRMERTTKATEMFRCVLS
jgi:hypothetical protein